MSPSNKLPLKTTRFKRHSNYYAFRKSRSWQQNATPAKLIELFDILAPFGRFVIAFWRSLDFEEGLQIDSFLKIKKQIRKTSPPKTSWNKHYLLIDFLMPKWEAWYCKKDAFVLYLLQNMSCLRVVKRGENWCQKISLKRVKSTTLAAPVRIL